MIREITFTLSKSARLVSGNEVRNAPGMVNHRRATAQHKAVNTQLGSAFPRCRLALDDGSINTFTITLTRISAGHLDAHDHQITFKWVIDAVSMWILGITDRKRAGQDDDRAIFTWKTLQQEGPRGHYGITISIEDRDTLPDVRKIVGTPVPQLGAPGAGPAQRGQSVLSKARRGPPVVQRSLVFKACWAALPWEQDPLSDEYVLVDASRLAGLLETPAAISVVNPRTQRPVTLFRHAHQDPGLGGEVWLYTAEAPRLGVLGDGTRTVDGVAIHPPVTHSTRGQQ